MTNREHEPTIDAGEGLKLLAFTRPEAQVIESETEKKLLEVFRV